MADPIQSKRVRWLALMLLGTLSIVARGAKADDLVIPLEVAQPNFVGLGGGGATRIISGLTIPPSA